MDDTREVRPSTALVVAALGASGQRAAEQAVAALRDSRFDEVDQVISLAHESADRGDTWYPIDCPAEQCSDVSVLIRARVDKVARRVERVYLFLLADCGELAAISPDDKLEDELCRAVQSLGADWRFIPILMVPFRVDPGAEADSVRRKMDHFGRELMPEYALGRSRAYILTRLSAGLPALSKEEDLVEAASVLVEALVVLAATQPDDTAVDDLTKVDEDAFEPRDGDPETIHPFASACAIKVDAPVKELEYRILPWALAEARQRLLRQGDENALTLTPFEIVLPPKQYGAAVVERIGVRWFPNPLADTLGRYSSFDRHRERLSGQLEAHRHSSLDGLRDAIPGIEETSQHSRRRFLWEFESAWRNAWFTSGWSKGAGPVGSAELFCERQAADLRERYERASPPNLLGSMAALNEPIRLPLIEITARLRTAINPLPTLLVLILAGLLGTATSVSLLQEVAGLSSQQSFLYGAGISVSVSLILYLFLLQLPTWRLAALYNRTVGNHVRGWLSDSTLAKATFPSVKGMGLARRRISEFVRVCRRRQENLRIFKLLMDSQQWTVDMGSAATARGLFRRAAPMAPAQETLLQQRVTEEAESGPLLKDERLFNLVVEGHAEQAVERFQAVVSSFVMEEIWDRTHLTADGLLEALAGDEDTAAGQLSLFRGAVMAAGGGTPSRYLLCPRGLIEGAVSRPVDSHPRVAVAIQNAAYLVDTQIGLTLRDVKNAVGA